MIKQVIAVASGKGGVGKSTVAVNLAIGLKKTGHSVGILDADLYGPSLPILCNTIDQVTQPHNDKMQPIFVEGIPTMSVGYVIDKNAPAIWRGPMASKVIQQLFYNTHWGELDYLVIDLPPGTGDIHLTLAQKLPLQGVIIVTTPQMVSIMDVKKAIAMFQKIEIPIVGLVENMSTYTCHACCTTTHLFGKGGGEIMAKEYDIPLLGHLPFDSEICAKSDRGEFFSHQNRSESDTIYRQIVKKLVENNLFKHKKFSTVVLED